MSIVLQLSQDIIITLLTDWFESLELTVFDSALCNKNLRMFLLDSFSSDLYHHKGCDELEFRPEAYQRNYDFNEWIMLRKIKIIALNLETSDILSKQFENILSVKLQNLHFDMCCGRKNNEIETCVKVTVLHYISMKFCHLRTLEITFSSNGNELSVINFIKSNIHLQSVQFFFDSSLGDKCLLAISNSCINIEEVHIHHVANDVSLCTINHIVQTCKYLKFITLVPLGGKRMFRMHNETDELNFTRCTLRLSGFDEVSDFDKQKLMELNHVCVLWLSHFSLTDDFIMSSLGSWRQLTFLTLDTCGSMFSRVGLIKLISHCKKLSKIHLLCCCHLSNLDLIEVLTLKGNVLEFIGITCHKHIDLTTLCAIVLANKGLLTHVCISKCKHLEDGDLVDYCLHLQNSDIIICSEIF
jgi:hypothetical protein